MICTAREAYEKDCCVFDKLCTGPNCMGWVKLDGSYFCGICDKEHHSITDAQECCNHDVFLTKGYCGRAK